MAPIVVAIKSAWGFIATAIAKNAIVGAIAQAALGVAASLAINALFARKPQGVAPVDEGLELRLRIVPDHPIEVLYGTAMTGGSLSYPNTRGTNNEYLERVVILSDWRCDGVVNIYGDGEVLTFDGDVTTGYRACTSHYLDEGGNPCLWVRIYLGDPDQTADAELVANYADLDSNFRLRGRAYAITRMKWNRDAYATGEAELLYEMRGAPCHDPRDGGSDPDDASTWSWTDNPALIAAQYHAGFYLNSKLLCGLGWPRTRIPDAALIEAANECDELVALNAGGSEKRYRCGGSFLVGRKGRTHLQNLSHLEEAMDGSIDTGAGRSVRILPGVERAAVPIPIRWDDTIRGEIVYDPDAEPAQRINQSTGRFTDPDSVYEQYEIPLVVDEAYLAADGGQEYVDDPTLLAVQSFTQAQRILKRRRTRSRFGATLAFSVPLFPYLQLERGDRVYLDSAFRSVFALDDIAWRVARRPSITYSREGGGLRVNLALRAHPDSIGDWDEATDEVAKPGASSTRPGLPTLELANVAVTAVELTIGAMKQPAVLVTWDAGDSRVRVQVTGTRLDGDEGSPVSPVETITNTVTADTGRCYVLGGLPGGHYQVAYGLAHSGRFSGQTVADTSLQLTANLEPTGVGGVSAADIAAAADDGVLTPSEKQQIVPFLEGLLTEYSGALLTTRAGIYSVSTTAYTTALGALQTYLGGLTSAVAWNNLTGNTTIVGATWVSTIQAAVEARDALIDAIETASGRNNVIIDGSGRFQGGGGGNGTYINNGLININADGSWTNGAGGSGSVTLSGLGGGGLAVLDWVRFGTNVRGSDGLTVIGDSDVFNSEITIDPDGTLNGGGGGQVTFAGLGGGSIGLLNFINNTHWSGTALAVANGGTGATTASGGRTNLGLGGLAVLDDITLSLVTDAGALAALNSVNNTNWSGTALAVANGGTGATTESGARSALGLGSLAVLSNVADAQVDPSADIKLTKINRPVASATRGSATAITDTSFTTIVSVSLTDVPVNPAILINGSEFQWPAGADAASSAAVSADWQIIEDNGSSTTVVVDGTLTFVNGVSFVEFDDSGLNAPGNKWTRLYAANYSGSVTYRLQVRITSGTSISPTSATTLQVRAV